MKYLLVGWSAFVLAGLAFAQSPEPDSAVVPCSWGDPRPGGICDPVVLSVDSTCVSGSCSCVPRCWGTVEYLLWWFKDAPANGPLVTSGNPAVNHNLPGALGQPDTTVMLGDRMEFPGLSGGRLTVGTWLDSQSLFGIEASGFFLGKGASQFSAASANNGVPAIYIPVINQTPTSSNFGGQGSIAVADVPNAGLLGAIMVGSTTRLWGAEANGVFNLYNGGRLSVDGLFGFRYADLRESLNLNGTSIDITGIGVNQQWVDQFGTANHFYGGQLGTRLDWESRWVSLELDCKVAMGADAQKVNIQGASVWGGPGFPLPPGVYPGGLLTEPSNIGEHSGTDFGVIPELEVKFGWNFTRWAKLTIGYDFFYWTGMVRPGNQIDRNVNFTQIPGAQQFFGPPIPPFVPLPQFNRSDFFANGLNVGLTFGY